jgi:hypothetical protein
MGHCPYSGLKIDERRQDFGEMVTGKVEEIWMKIVPFYINSLRIDSGSSCWVATSIRVLRNKIKRKLCSEHTDVYYVCGACFYFWSSNFSSADYITSAFHQTMVPLTDPPLAVLLGTCCVGNWPSSWNRSDWDPAVIE